MIGHNDVAFVIDAGGNTRTELSFDPGPGTASTESSFAAELTSVPSGCRSSHERDPPGCSRHRPYRGPRRDRGGLRAGRGLRHQSGVEPGPGAIPAALPAGYVLHQLRGGGPGHRGHGRPGGPAG